MSRPRRSSWAGWIGVALLAALGILAGIRLAAPDAEAIRSELRKRREELDLIPAEEAIRKDEAAHDLLGQAKYREFAPALYASLERAHGRLHERADLERSAAKAVPPFLAGCRDLSGLSPEQLSERIDEGRALLAGYGSSRSGPALREALAGLEQALEERARPAGLETLELLREVYRSAEEGHFAPAWRRIEKFSARVKAAPDALAQVKACRELVLRRAQGALDRLLAGVRRDPAPEARRRALELLDGPDWSGLPLPGLDRAREELRRS